METGSKGPPLRLENLAAYLDDKLEHETQVLDLLVVAQARGQGHPELWDKLHSAALRDDRLTELAFAYEKLAQDRRVRIMPPPLQAQIFVNAARFFMRALGDLDGTQAALERVLTLVPGHPEAFDQLQKILEDKGDRDKLVALHMSAVGPKTDKESALVHLRAALALALEGEPDKASKIAQQILKLDSSNQEALAAIGAALEAAGKHSELARVLEQALGTDPPPAEERRLELRIRLLELYDDRVPEVERATPHVEEVLAIDPQNGLARRVALRLMTNKAVAARAAAALEKVYEAEGDRGGVAQMLAAQIEQLRGPKKAEAQKRLGNILYDTGEDALAFTNFEAVMAIDPSDEDVRVRYVELARKLGKHADASKMLSRAAASVKSPQIRARINLDTARFLVELGDPKRARVILQGILDQAEGEVSLEAARVLRQLVEEPKGLAPILEGIAKLSLDPDEKLEVLRTLAGLYESELDDLALAIQARKRILQIDPTAQPEELERLLEARKDWATLAEVLEIRAYPMEPTEERRELLLRAASLRSDQVGDDAGAIADLNLVRTEHGPARDIHALLIPLLQSAGDHATLTDVLGSEIELAEEQERPALLTSLAEALLATGQLAEALEALAEVISVTPDQPGARARLAELLEQGEGAVRLRAAQILAPVLRAEEDAPNLVIALDVIADQHADAGVRIEALAEAHANIDAIGKDKVRALFLAGRGLREAVAHDVEQVPEWIERIARSGGGASKAAVAEAYASPLRDRKIDHPNLARLAQRTGDSYAAAGDIARGIEAFRRVLDFEPDNEEMVERIDHLLAEKGSPDERITLYKNALARPGSVDRRRGLYLAIGAVQMDQLRKAEAAIETYRGALAELTGDRALRDALLDALEHAKSYRELYEELLQDRSSAEADVAIAEHDLRLAPVAVLLAEPANAAAHYREALAVTALDVDSDTLDRVEELATAEGDVPLLVAVAERRVQQAKEAARASALEHLGTLVGERSGDPARAALHFLEAGDVALELDDLKRAAASYEKVLAYQPDTRAALQKLVKIHAARGDERLLAVTQSLVDLSEAEDALALVAQVAGLGGQHGTDTERATRLLDMVQSIEQRFSPSMSSLEAKTTILASAGRIVEAAGAIAAMLEDDEHGAGAMRALQALLAAHADEPRLLPARRGLLEYRALNAKEGDKRARQLELFRFELDVAEDPLRAARVLDQLLDADPEDDEALVERYRLAAASGDFETAARCLQTRLSTAEDDDARAERAADLAKLHLEKRADVGRALDAIEPLLITHPEDPTLLEVALAALSEARFSKRAVLALTRIADALTEPPRRASIYKALFDRAESEASQGGGDILDGGATELFSAWLASIVSDPAYGLEVAARAARHSPEQSEFWDRAEELAREVKRPEPVASAYRAVLGAAKDLSAEVTLLVGERGVAFHEEWFDDAELVTDMLRKIVDAAPSAAWAFERLKLVYNAAERWQELFELYDRVIHAQDEDEGRALILEDAVEMARDLAGDSERAMGYLEQLRRVRPDDGRIESQLERLYERHGRGEALVDLLAARMNRLAGDEARGTRLRIASLFETSVKDLSRALEVLRPLVEAADEEVIAIVERWLAATVPTIDPGRPGFRLLSSAVPFADPVRIAAARLLEPIYFAQGADDKATRMLEVTLESEPDLTERVKVLRTLSERKSGLGDTPGALEATLAELALTKSEEDETAAVGAALLVAGDNPALLGRAVDALRELGEEEEEKLRSLRLLRKASSVAREELEDESRCITIDLAILSRSDEDPVGAREAAKKLDRDLLAAGREADRCAVLERLATLEDTPEARRTALLEAARIAEEVIGDRQRAIRALRRWLDEVPVDVEVLSSLIANLRFVADSRALVAALDKRAQATRSTDEAQSDRVEIARILGRVLEDRPAAIDAYRLAMELHGPADELIDELAALLEGEGRDEELATLLQEEAVRSVDRDRRSLLYAKLGDIERKRGNLSPSLDAFVAALKLVPASSRAQGGLETLIGALSPADPAVHAIFAQGVNTLASSFEQAGQTDRWLALVPARLLATKNDLEKCDLLLRAAKLEEEVSGNDLRALERTVQAFALKPEFPGLAEALLTRGRTTGRWDLAAPHLLPALAARDDIPHTVARDLLVAAADWARGAARGPGVAPGDSRGLVEGLLSAAHARSPDDTEVLERLVVHRRQTPGKALVDALLSLARLRGADLELLREAATVTLRDVGDEQAAASIAEVLVKAASEELRRTASSPHEEAESIMLWAIDVLDPLLRATDELVKLRQLLTQAAALPIEPARARQLLLSAAQLAQPEEAIGIYERLYASDSTDLDVAQHLAALYGELDKKVELARLYGRMADGIAGDGTEGEERARLRLLQAELLVALGTTDPAISVLRQSLAELATHEASVRLLSSLLEGKKAFQDLANLLETQGELAKKTDPARGLELLRRAAALAEEQLRDAPRAARSFWRVVDIDPSQDNLDRLATLLEQARQYDDEAKTLERLIEEHGRTDDLSLRLATSYGRGGHVERAREQLESAVRDGKGSPRVREVLAGIYREAGAWESLAQLFESEADEATDVATQVQRLREAAVILTRELQRPEAAVPLLVRAAALRPDDLESSLMLSAALRTAGRLDESRSHLARILAEFGTRKPKERALVHFELAKLAIAAKDRAVALTELDNASKIDPAQASVLQLLGEVALEEGQFLRAQRTYRGLLLVLRSQRSDKGAAAAAESVPHVFKSQVLVELAFIAERQKDAARRAEFVESAFESAREDPAEHDALVAALDRRGYFDLVARALAAQLESQDLAGHERTDLELRLAELYGSKLDRAQEAGDLAVATFERSLEHGGASSLALETRLTALLAELGQTGRVYDSLSARSESASGEERADLLMRAAHVAETSLKDDTRAAAALEALMTTWTEGGGGTPEERAGVLARLDTIVTRLVASGAAPAERQAKILEQVIDQASSEGGTFSSVEDSVYRLVDIYTEGAHIDSAYALLERAAREDANGDRVDERLRQAIERCASDGRFVRLLEDFGRDRGRPRAVVDALELLAERAADPTSHLRDAYETSIGLEDPVLTERLLRRLVPASAEDDTAEHAWAIVALAEGRFGASDAREAAALWERASRVSDPEEERALLLRVADLADRVLGDAPRAAGIYEGLRKREPAEREFWAPLADIYTRSSDTEALAQLMDETIPLVDDLRERAKLRLSLAKMLEVTDPDRAADVLGEAIDEDPQSLETAQLLERLYSSTGRDDKLTMLLERQLDVAKDGDDKPRVVALSMRIGALRERLGQEDAALDAYHGAIDWQPENLEALRAAVRLHTQREDSLVMNDLLDRLLDLEQGDGAVELALKIADMKLGSGDAAGAERSLLIGFKANARSGELKQRLSALYTERNDRVGLARLAASEARIFSDPKVKRQALLQSAETIKNEGEATEAADLYAEALEDEPTDRDTLFFFMETCANSGQHARAITAVDRALATDTGDPWLLFSRAVLREAVGESDAALDDLEAAFDRSGGQYAAELRAHLEAALVRISREPSSSRRSEASIRLRLAEVAAQGGDVESARIVVEELLHHDPQNASALATLARIEELSGRVDAAALSYARAVGMASGAELTTIALRLFNACNGMGRLGLARAGLERAFQAAPVNAELRAALRAVYEDTGALIELADLVVDESRAATDSNQQFDKLLEAARLLLYGTGESSAGPAMAERALVVLEEARGLRPADQDMLQLASESLAALGRGDEARSVLTELIAAHKNKRSRELGQVYYSLYRVESKNGNLSDALAALSKAHDNQPQNGGIALELGQLAVDLDEQDVAQRAFRSVTLLKTDGTSGVSPQERAVAYYHLGSIAFKAGDARRAKLMLEKSLAEDPSLDGARELLGQL